MPTDSGTGRIRRILRENGLSLAMFGLFAIFLLAQSVTGWRSNNATLVEHHEAPLSYASYITTGHFVEAVFENWESEFLQMASYVVLTVWLVQKGSSESKPPKGDEKLDADPRNAAGSREAPGPVRRGGWRLRIYEHSLSLAFVILFLLSIALHAIGGAHKYSAEQVAHGEPPVAVAQFVTTWEFWFQSFQNWQSEFLAVGVLVVLTIHLRERGSPESKPVAAPHSQTGE